MGKRAGNAIDLDTVIADIGPDATRILSLMSSLDQAATFDLAAVREQSAENPVFYVQMASARIGGVGRKAAERGIVRAAARRRRPVAAHPPPGARGAPLPRGAARGGGRRRRRPGPDQGHHLGPPAGRRASTASTTTARSWPTTSTRPLAQARLWLVEAHADRPGHRARPARGARARGDVSRAASRPARSTRSPACPDDGRASAPTAASSVGGCDLVDLAEHHGTPLFVYDEAHLRAALPGGGGGLGRRRGLRHQGVPVRGHGPAGPRGGDVPRRLHRR